MNFSETSALISASLLIEYWYCPRFVYFMNVLKIKQYEEKRLKVLKGREVHIEKTLQPDYLRKKIGVIKREKEVYLSSPEYGICGILDEVLFLQDGGMSLLDYKFAYNKHKFKTQFLQMVFYAILIEANFGKTVDRCYIVYTRERNKLVEYSITEKDRATVLKSVKSIRKIISGGYFPSVTSHKKKCPDCTYGNICIS